MLYLGANYVPDGSLKIDREARVTAANVGWCEHQGFWHSGAPYRCKRLVFIAVIRSAVFSGTEAWVATPTDGKALDHAQLPKLRSMMRGKACDKTEDNPPTPAVGVLEQPVIKY